MRPALSHTLPLAALSLFVLSCSGGGSSGADKTPTAPAAPARTAVTLTASSSVVQPLQQTAVTFPSSPAASGVTITGTLGTLPVQIAMTDSLNGSYIVPDLAAGSAVLTVDYGTLLRGTATLSVSAPAVIADPKSAVNAALAFTLTTTDSMVAKIRATPDTVQGLTLADATYLATKAAELRANLAAASPADLKVLAQFLAANPSIFPSSETVVADATLAQTAPASTSFAEISARVDNFIRTYTARKIKLVYSIGSCIAVLAATSWTGLVAGAVVVGCGVTIGLQSSALVTLMQGELANTYADPESVNITEVPSSSADTPLASDGARPVSTPFTNVSVEPGQTTTLYTKGTLRTFNSGDRGIIGPLFSAVDEAATAIGSITQYLPGWARPNLTVPSLSRRAVFALDASDFTANVPGCSATPSGNAFSVLCTTVSPTDVVNTATFTYRNSYASVSGSIPFTIKRTWAAVGAPQVSNVGSVTNGCRFNMVIPVSGNTPVTFTSWSGNWSNGHAEGGASGAVVDPRKFSGITWWSNQPVTSNTSEKSFTVGYIVTYSVAALGQTGSTSTTVSCTK